MQVGLKRIAENYLVSPPEKFSSGLC